MSDKTYPPLNGLSRWLRELADVGESEHVSNDKFLQWASEIDALDADRASRAAPEPAQLMYDLHGDARELLAAAESDDIESLREDLERHDLNNSYLRVPLKTAMVDAEALRRVLEKAGGKQS